MLMRIYGDEQLSADRHRWDAFKAVSTASENIDCQVWLLRKDAKAFGTEQLTEHGSNLDFHL